MNVQPTFGKLVTRQAFSFQCPIANIQSCHSERSEESQDRDVFASLNMTGYWLNVDR
jgi:hypothetical protein